MSGYRELYKELVKPSQRLITDYLVKEKKITEVPKEALPCRSDDVILSSSDESDLAPIHKRKAEPHLVEQKSTKYWISLFSNIWPTQFLDKSRKAIHERLSLCWRSSAWSRLYHCDKSEFWSQKLLEKPRNGYLRPNLRKYT
ncbi:hypothetical protein LAZ67_6003048 [Cordylochernes scorpioides]|uniref:Uncharacterized protein n=1 Tax=Cordylochernes scorpioides TaxID=51811 RepID=A0ABY6KK84_9ARAC|nr:hypothetical protein LAZ67_6003048 [Cordylochernes scorpioides]